jgi:ankyrin repeat protein
MRCGYAVVSLFAVLMAGSGTPLTCMAASLDEAILQGHAEEVKRNLVEGADIKRRITVGATQSQQITADSNQAQMQVLADPLLVAICLNHADVVAVLLDHGVDPNKPVRKWVGKAMVFGTPVNAAIQNGNVEILKMLVDKGAKVTQQDLMRNKYVGQPECIEFLVSQGFDPNAKAPMEESGRKLRKRKGLLRAWRS